MQSIRRLTQPNRRQVLRETGAAADPPEWQEHIRNKQRRKDIGDRMKDPYDPLKVVIVRDMWLTGFDVPCLHTMYLDKPMRGHGLMQAIARVNRVFKDKPGGLIVDYLGVAVELKKALSEYTESGGRGKPAFEQDEAVAVMVEKYEIVSALFYGFDYTHFFTSSTKDKLSILVLAQEHILKQENGKERCLKYVTQLSKAFALMVKRVLRKHGYPPDKEKNKLQLRKALLLKCLQRPPKAYGPPSAGSAPVPQGEAWMRVSLKPESGSVPHPAA